MAQFDVYRERGKRTLVVDCQSNFCDYLDTRFVVPLIPAAGKPPQASRLNPVVEIEGIPHVLAPNAAATVPVRDLDVRVYSLASDQDVIKTALDQLITGF